MLSRKLASQLLLRWPDANSLPMTDPASAPFLLQFLQASFFDASAKKGTEGNAEVAGLEGFAAVCVCVRALAVLDAMCSQACW